MDYSQVFRKKQQFKLLQKQQFKDELVFWKHTAFQFT